MPSILKSDKNTVDFFTAENTHSPKHTLIKTAPRHMIKKTSYFVFTMLDV